MGSWFNRRDNNDNRKPAIIERERQMRQRRRLFALGFGIFMALFAGMLGFGQSTEIIIVFSVLGFILGLSGGWMAASVDLWPTNTGNERQWSKRYMRSTQLERDIFDSYVAPDDEEDRE